jgi:hypothetical protein
VNTGTSNISEQRVYSQIVLNRLDAMDVPAELKPYIAAFREAYEAYEKAAKRATEERENRDAALEAVKDADNTLNRSVNALADKLVGAGLGKPQNPFVRYTKPSPSRLAALPYAERSKKVRELALAVKKAGAPPDVRRAMWRCLRNADASEVALGKLTKPQAAYIEALAEQEALLPSWTKALRKLRQHAALEWYEDARTFHAVFAQPSAVKAPKKARAKKKATGAAAWLARLRRRKRRAGRGRGGLDPRGASSTSDR